MRLKIVQASLAAILAALLAASVGFARLASAPEPRRDLTVSAAISLKDALNAAAELYRAERPDTEIHFNLGASGTLQRQIEQGAPVDVFISASEDQMNSLESQGLLLSGTRKRSAQEFHRPDRSERRDRDYEFPGPGEAGSESDFDRRAPNSPGRQICPESIDALSFVRPIET